jgi:hypothetical protein
MRWHAVAIPDTPPPMMITRHGGSDKRFMAVFGERIEEVLDHKIIKSNQSSREGRNNPFLVSNRIDIYIIFERERSVTSPSSLQSYV